MLQSLFQNKAGLNTGMPTETWQTPKLDQRKTINSTLPSIMGTQTPTATANPSTISGVKFNRPTGWVDEFGGNGELMGVSQWDQYFEGLSNLGEGYSVEGVNGQGYAGVGGAPNSFTINRADPNGDKNVYQQRQLTVNPDGTVSWANDSNWVSKKQQSQMGHFLEAGLPMALAMVGGVNFLGGTTGGLGGAAGGLEGLSGMDLAADAALGSGNNILTAGAGLGEAAGAASAAGGTSNLYSLGGGEVGGSGTLIPGTGTTGLQATAGPGTSLFTPTAQGAGLTVPGLTAAGGTGAMDVLKGLGKALIGGQAGGISALGNLASLFTNYKQYSNTGDLIDEIKGIYSPDGVYAKELEKQLARRDAAAGRNSQYGPRLAELMARLGDSQARSLGGLGGMMQTQQGGLNGMVGSGSRLLDGLGGLEKLFSIFGD